MRLILNLATIAFASAQSFLSFDILPAPLIEWDQTNLTYYTGQTISMNWTSQNFGASDYARIQYQGAGGTRTLTTGSGVFISAETYRMRLSDSSNGIATNVPVNIALTTNTAVTRNSAQLITVIQSRVQNIVPSDGNRTLGSGQSTVCDNRQLQVTWRGLGEAQFGLATVTLRRQSGFSGTQTLATVSSIPASGNTTVSLVCPRTTSPSSSNQYAFEISVIEPGGSAYTGTSTSFSVSVAPTPSNTPSTTPTPTRTPTSSETPTNTPTPSISITSSVSPSRTQTPTPTPSTTPSANPSIDVAGIARAAAESVDTQTPAIAGAVGGIAGILLLLGIWKVVETKRLTEKRKKRLAMTSRYMKETQSMYGVDPPTTNVHPNIVMYTVANIPSKTSLSKKNFEPKVASK